MLIHIIWVMASTSKKTQRWTSRKELGLQTCWAVESRPTRIAGALVNKCQWRRIKLWALHTDSLYTGWIAGCDVAQVARPAWKAGTTARVIKTSTLKASGGTDGYITQSPCPSCVTRASLRSSAITIHACSQTDSCNKTKIKENKLIKCLTKHAKDRQLVSGDSLF